MSRCYFLSMVHTLTASLDVQGADEAFLSKVPIPKSQIHAIKEGLPVKEAATEYAGQLIGLPNSVLPRTAAGFPVFDLMLLGMQCSL